MTRSNQTASSLKCVGIPAGFRLAAVGGAFITANGPLYCKGHGQHLRFGLRVGAQHVNSAGNLHGGMMASFCDVLLSMSVKEQDQRLAHRLLPTVSLQIDYLAPSPLASWLEGEAELMKATRTLVFARGVVVADGTVCSRASAVFKIGKVLIPAQEKCTSIASRVTGSDSCVLDDAEE